MKKKEEVPVGPFKPTRAMDRKQLFIGWPNVDGLTHAGLYLVILCQVKE